MIITPEFILSINCWDGTEAFPPYSALETLKERLMEHYSADEDGSFACIELKNLQEVVEVIELYKGRDVHISLHCTVKNEQVYVASTLASKKRSLSRELVTGELRVFEPKEISIRLAAEKLWAVANALETKAMKEEKK